MTVSVRQTVERQPALYADVDGHILILITHEAMKQANLVSYAGWHLTIDEVPSVVDRQAIRSALTRAFFAEHYELRDLGSFRQVCSRSNATVADLRRDTLAEPLAMMHARVLDERITVLTELKSWNDLQSDKDWHWTSLWSPSSLSDFASVHVLASGFTQSLTYSVWSQFDPQIQWLPMCRPTLRPFARRTLSIRYFASEHTASRAMFNTDQGKSHLAAISEYISVQHAEGDMIWTCNERDRRCFATLSQVTDRLAPRQAGSNRHSAGQRGSITLKSSMLNWLMCCAPKM